MKKQIRAASAILLAACSAATMLTACGEKNPPIEESTVPASVISSETSVTLNENSVIADTVTTVAYVSTVTTVHTDKTAAPVSVKENAKTTAAATTQKPTTTKAPSTEVIPEKSNGISLMTKTTPVVIGNSAVIMVQGTAGKKYTIDFYKSADKTADYDGLETKTADSNGFVTWTFVIDDSCDRGNRKIVIKEKNSSNYLQTSIAVQ